ncbi:hypothetical protein [Eubacterium callanderi]|uniref:hypothetical protein n=1 Tax=Eubacterium callanderi TaxID=53442 RepID=UPI001C118935|nr:hypothetical protein [Eubacterium callanderi]MBU5302495.1 hypothetical protein [Eubacterium callanderi]
MEKEKDERELYDENYAVYKAYYSNPSITLYELKRDLALAKNAIADNRDNYGGKMGLLAIIFASLAFFISIIDSAGNLLLLIPKAKEFLVNGNAWWVTSVMLVFYCALLYSFLKDFIFKGPGPKELKAKNKDLIAKAECIEREIERREIQHKRKPRI